MITGVKEHKPADYTDQSNEVCPDCRKTRSVKTGRGVSQECCLSPNLFNLYSEYLTRKALEKFQDFKIEGQVIHCEIHI
jgi:hypothetical protein